MGLTFSQPPDPNRRPPGLNAPLPGLAEDYMKGSALRVAFGPGKQDLAEVRDRNNYEAAERVNTGQPFVPYTNGMQSLTQVPETQGPGVRETFNRQGANGLMREATAEQSVQGIAPYVASQGAQKAGDQERVMEYDTNQKRAEDAMRYMQDSAMQDGPFRKSLEDNAGVLATLDTPTRRAG